MGFWEGRDFLFLSLTFKIFFLREVFCGKIWVCIESEESLFLD